MQIAITSCSLLSLVLEVLVLIYKIWSDGGQI
jgi:hypothetical protein